MLEGKSLLFISPPLFGNLKLFLFEQLVKGALNEDEKEEDHEEFPSILISWIYTAELASHARTPDY